MATSRQGTRPRGSPGDLVSPKSEVDMALRGSCARHQTWLGGHEAHWGALDLEIGGLLRWRSAQREKPMSQLSHEVMPQVIR